MIDAAEDIVADLSSINLPSGDDLQRIKDEVADLGSDAI